MHRVLIVLGEAYNIQVWTGAEAFVMIVCGNIPPLKTLWDRFVTHKSDSNYARTPVKYKIESRPSKFSGTNETSSTGNSAHILSSQHENYSRDGSYMKEPRIKAVTDIDVSESTRSMV